MATPANTKMVRLKKTSLNVSKVSKTAATPKNGKNFSFLNANTSVTRASLRANNRSLAQNLARLKLELRTERNANMELKSELQELKLSVNRLKRLVGLRDEKIDEEVNKRMVEQFSPLFDLVERSVGNLYNTGKSLSELQDKCIEMKRDLPATSDRTSLPDRSCLSDRNSLPTDTETASPDPASQANTLAQASRFLPDKTGRREENTASKSLRAADGLSLFSTRAAAQAHHTDISIIAEQSFLGDTSVLPEPEHQKEKKTSHETESSTVVPKKKAKKKSSKMPQRVPIKAKYQPPDFSKPRASIRTEADNKAHQTSQETADPFKPTTSLQRSPMKRAAPQPVDPFKPTKTLLRSPIIKNSMSVTLNEESPPEKINSQDFFASLAQDSTVGILDEPIPCPGVFEDEPTQFFNCDMEFTSVMDMTKMAANSKSPNVPISEVEESPENDNKSKNLTVPPTKVKSVKSGIKSPKKKTVSKEKEAKPVQTDAASSNDADNAAAVEVKTVKPGVFTYSVSRKEADGSRKPVPEKKSHARSKKKPKVVEKEEEPRKTKEDRDMFNFGDRSPTIPLDKLQKPTSAVYDAMDESNIPPQTSLNSFRENMQKINTVKTKEGGKSAAGEKEQSNIYYLPLKGCTDDEPAETAKPRGRSRSRKRDCSEDDDDDWVPEKRPKSRSRARKRISSEPDEVGCKRSRSSAETDSQEQPTRRSARSKSRQRKSSETEEESNVGQDIESADRLTTVRRSARSRSRPRKVVDSDEEEQVEKPRSGPGSLSHENKSEESVAHNNVEESTRSRSRSKVSKDTTSSKRVSARSRSRPRQATDIDDVPSSSTEPNTETDILKSPKVCEESEGPRPSARSRSRARQNQEDSQKQERSETDSSRRSESEGQTDQATVPTRRSARSRSRARVLVESDDEDSSGKSENKVTMKRATRSRSRPRIIADSDDEGSTENNQVESDKKSNTADKATVKRSARSRSRPRLTVDSDDESSEKPTVESKGNARQADKATVRRSARSRSRPRIVIDSDDEEQLEKPRSGKSGSARKRARAILLSDSEDDTSGNPNEDVVTGRQVSSRAESRDVATTAPTGTDVADHSRTASNTVSTRKSPTLLDPDVYYLPLKGSPTKAEKPKTTRSRSRSRSRLRESDPDKDVQCGSRSGRRSTKSEVEESDAKFEDLMRRVSVRSKRSKSRGRRETSPEERGQAGGSTLVLPDFILDCSSPVNHTGDAEVTDTTNKIAAVHNSPTTPSIGMESCESQLSKSVKTVNGSVKSRSRSARKQKTDTKKSEPKTKCATESPEREDIQTEEVENKRAAQSKSGKKKQDSERLSPDSERTSLVLPEFSTTPATDNSDCQDFISSRRSDKKVLTDRVSDMNSDCESGEAKSSRKKSDRKKLSTKTPKIEDDDFKVPKTKSVKAKSTRKPKSTGAKSGKKKATLELDTPKAEVQVDSDYSPKASRKRLDDKFLQPEASDDTPQLKSGSPISESKRSKKSKGERDSSGHRGRAPVNDENEQPLSGLARLKQKLSMISSRPRASMQEIDNQEDDDRRHSCQADTETHGTPVAATVEGHEKDGERTRRNKPQISYCTKPLNAKLRRGDDMFEKKLSKENAEKARLLMSKKMLMPKEPKKEPNE